MDDLKRCVGINLTSSKLQFVEIEKKSDLLIVDNLGQSFLRPPIIFDEQNEIVIQEQIQAAFDEIKIRTPLKSNTVSFTLPPELFITIQLPYDSNLNQAEIKEEFNWEISQLLPFISIDDLAVKFYELQEGLLPGKNNALIVALNKKYLMLIKNFCVKNYLTPKLVDNASITANSFINSFYNSRNGPTINIFNSRKSISLFINISSKPAFVKAFPKDDNEYVNKIIDEISKINIRGVVKNNFNGAIFSGEDLESDLLSEIGRGTELVFEKLNPFEMIKFRQDFNDQQILSEQFSSFISATGIATRFN